MSDISARADRFVRQVFKKNGKSADPKKDAEIRDRRESLMKARERVIKSRKRY